MLISNKPIKVFDLQILVNQFMLNGALVTEMVNNSLMQSKTFSESSRQSCSVVEKGVLKILQESTCTGHLYWATQVFSIEICKIFKNTCIFM